MGWPKGKPRKGHVNKDGSTHAKWGQKVQEAPERPVKARRTARRRIVRVDPSLLDEAPQRRGREPMGGEDAWPKPQHRRLLVHKSGPWTAICPNCDFPEADGGHCIVCGWTIPTKAGDRV